MYVYVHMDVFHVLIGLLSGFGDRLQRELPTKFAKASDAKVQSLGSMVRVVPSSQYRYAT
jgi:hypothetical protein